MNTLNQQQTPIQNATTSKISFGPNQSFGQMNPFVTQNGAMQNGTYQTNQQISSKSVKRSAPTLPQSVQRNGYSTVEEQVIRQGQSGQGFIDQTLLAGGTVDARAFVEERQNRAAFGYEQTLKKENEILKSELHRLRKIEHSWTPTGPDEETRVFIVNNYQHQINQNIEEIKNLNSTLTILQQENASLKQQISSGVRSVEVGKEVEQSSLIESLKRQIRELDQELRQSKAQIGQLQDKNSNAILEERQHWSSILAAEKASGNRLKEELNQLRMQTNGPANGQNELTRRLQEQLKTTQIEIERRNSAIAQLESRLQGGHQTELVIDETGIRDRDRLIEHYKSKWDEVAKENNMLKSQLTLGVEQNTKIKMRNEVINNNNIEHTLYRERELLGVIQQELRMAKEELAFFKSENQRLLSELSRFSGMTNQKEVFREVIIDRTGEFSKNLAANPQANPLLIPGQVELVSRTIGHETINQNSPMRQQAMSSDNSQVIRPRINTPPIVNTSYYNPPLSENGLKIVDPVMRKVVGVETIKRHQVDLLPPLTSNVQNIII